MAAIWGCSIDNLIIELDGEEVPIMDGSSQPFVFMLECAGFKTLRAKRLRLKVLKEVAVHHQDSEIFLTPSNEFKINMVIDFKSKAIGRQERAFSISESFKDSLASARTFGFVQDLEHLKQRGLAKGASLDNAVGIENDTVINKDGLRFEDEFVRHKLLDSVGDFFTAGGVVLGQFNSYKPGHALNNQLLRKLFEDPNSYEWIA
jgi:UDP-3-O-[3-hydroxymyristoyl] N-acetylglucosamine deacetylase